MSTIFFPLEGCLKSATERRTILASSVMKLFQEGFTPVPADPVATYDANEADYSGYVAQTITNWSLPMFAPGGGYMISTPLLQFMFDSGSGSVANNIAGAWVEDAAGAARQTVIFTDLIPVGADEQGVQFYMVALFTPSLVSD